MMYSDLDAMEFPFVIRGYKFISSIGKGSTADAYKVQHIDSRKLFAAKVIKCSSEANKSLEKRKCEIDYMKKLYHPNIIKIYDTFEENNVLFMILELCEKGSLKDLMSEGVRFSEKQILQIIKQILSALNYCHMNGIAHCDIKPGNIFVTKEGMVKLGDFGLAFNLKENSTSSNFSGSFAYKAPELIMEKRFSPLLADLWSLGVTFYVIATGNIPWSNRWPLMRNMIVNGVYSIPKTMTKNVANIIMSLIQVKPESRMSAARLLELPYFLTMKTTKVDFSLHKAIRIPLLIKPTVKSQNRKLRKEISSCISFPIRNATEHDCLTISKIHSDGEFNLKQY